MASDPWDPLADLSRMQRRMNKLFDTALARAEFEGGEGIEGYRPPSEVWETSGAWHLALELPGRNPDELSVNVEGDLLVISGGEADRPADTTERFHRMERNRSAFRSQFRLPDDLVRGEVHAQFEQGVLTIEIPRREPGKSDPIAVDIG